MLKRTIKSPYEWVSISSNLGVSLSSTTRTFLCCCSWWWFCVKIICCCFCLLATALQVALSKPSLISSSTDDDPCFPECILPFLKKITIIIIKIIKIARLITYFGNFVFGFFVTLVVWFSVRCFLFARQDRQDEMKNKQTTM